MYCINKCLQAVCSLFNNSFIHNMMILVKVDKLLDLLLTTHSVEYNNNEFAQNYIQLKADLLRGFTIMLHPCPFLFLSLRFINFEISRVIKNIY